MGSYTRQLQKEYGLLEKYIHGFLVKSKQKALPLVLFIRLSYYMSLMPSYYYKGVLRKEMKCDELAINLGCGSKRIRCWKFLQTSFDYKSIRDEGYSGHLLFMCVTHRWEFCAFAVQLSRHDLQRMCIRAVVPQQGYISILHCLPCMWKPGVQHSESSHRRHRKGGSHGV